MSFCRGVAERGYSRRDGRGDEPARAEERLPDRAQLPGRARDPGGLQALLQRARSPTRSIPSSASSISPPRSPTSGAAKPQDAVFFFLPGGMGINFVKQYVAAGCRQGRHAVHARLSADEDTIKAVGEPMIGILQHVAWAPTSTTRSTRSSSQEFQKEYGRLPTMYASQAYDVALLIDAAVRADRRQGRGQGGVAQGAGRRQVHATRGKFRFNTNHFRSRNYYLREVGKDAAGRITNKTIAKAFSDFQMSTPPSAR